MIINGTVVDIKKYETQKGKVINIFVREDPPTSIIYHIAQWKEAADEVENKLQVSDNVTISGYASGIEIDRHMITISGFGLIEVKRSIVTDQVILLDDQQTVTSKEGDSND